MIELTFNAFFLLYLFLTLFSVIGIWLFSHYNKKNRVFFTPEEQLFVCEYCHFPYLEKNIQQLSRCPQCGLLT